MPNPEVDDACWNLEELRESDFDARATFLVRDSPVDDGTMDRARASQPKNVTVKQGVSHTYSSPNAKAKTMITKLNYV